LSRYCSNYYLLLDGDEAGRKAIKRSMKDYEKYNLESYKIKFMPVYLPEKTDPDDFLIKNGKRGMIKKLRESKEEQNFL